MGKLSKAKELAEILAKKAKSYTDVGYHGAASDIEAFDPKKFGGSTQAESALQGVWSVDDPVTARGYADYAAKDVKVRNLIDEATEAEKAGNWDLYDQKLIDAENLEKVFYDEPRQGQNIMPLVSRADYAVVDMGGAEFMDVQGEIHDAINDARKKGFGGVRFQNLADDVGLNDRPATHTVTFNEADLRSPFARFDPEKAHIPNLSAGAAGAALGVGSMLPEEAEASSGRESLAATLSSAPLEAMSGVNRAAVDAVNWLGSDVPNAALQLMNSDYRVPSLYDIPAVRQGTEGNYMDEGTMRDVIRFYSEMLSPL